MKNLFKILTCFILLMIPVFAISFAEVVSDNQAVVISATVSDEQAMEAIMGLFDTMNSPGSMAVKGIAILTVFMTLLKTRWAGSVFRQFPKRVRQFLPVFLGAMIGLINAIHAEATGGGTLKYIFDGAMYLGGLQAILYHGLKGTLLGDMLAKFAGTYKQNTEEGYINSLQGC